MLLCVLPSASLAVRDLSDAVAKADVLYSMSLFRGTGTDASGDPIYSLERTPSRIEALILLIRLMGKEQEAFEGSWVCPFTDVPEATAPYAAYAYAKGLTKGVSAASFAPSRPVQGNTYLAGWDEDKRLWRMNDSGEVAEVPGVGRVEPGWGFAFYKNKVIIEDTSAGVYIKQYDLDTGDASYYSLILGQPYISMEQVVGDGSYSRSDVFSDRNAVSEIAVSRIFHSSDGLTMELKVSNPSNADHWIKNFTLDCLYNGEPFSITSIIAQGLAPGGSLVRYVVFPEFSVKDPDPALMECHLTTYHQF